MGFRNYAAVACDEVLYLRGRTGNDGKEKEVIEPCKNRR